MGTSDVAVTFSLLISSMLIGSMKSATSSSVFFLPLDAASNFASIVPSIATLFFGAFCTFNAISSSSLSSSVPFRANIVAKTVLCCGKRK
jgi:hypothetical protein